MTIEKQQELFPCPFCGMPAKRFAVNIIYCSDTVNCCAEVHFDAQCGDGCAAAAWNRRVTPNVPVEGPPSGGPSRTRS
jgi:hypothetical protein